eukprot:SAG22_NODE_2293_length_2748_cov_2.220838_2_plen_181_part_00
MAHCLGLLLVVLLAALLPETLGDAHVEPASYLQRVENDSPIHDAARKGDATAVGRLLDAGAVDCNNQRLVFDEHQLCVANVVNGFEGYGWPPLHDAVFAGHLDVMTLLLERGADVNMKTRSFGSTPLHWAAYAGQLEAAKLLIGDPWHADSNAKDDAGKTPMRAAPSSDYLNIERAWGLV